MKIFHFIFCMTLVEKTNMEGMKNFGLGNRHRKQPCPGSEYFFAGNLYSFL